MIPPQMHRGRGRGKAAPLSRKVTLTEIHDAATAHNSSPMAARNGKAALRLVDLARPPADRSPAAASAVLFNGDLTRSTAAKGLQMLSLH